MMDNMDINDAPAFLEPEGNEDSVDIYEGLDAGSITSDVVAEKSAPAELKESMNLFEEIVTEEQQSKEASYSELKSRFQAAQSQITDLHRRLERLELKNTGLSKENHRLKMNISILLQTARQEVTRKDAEIQRLNQQHNKGHNHLSRNNNPRDSGFSSRTRRPSPTIAPPAPLEPPPPAFNLPPRGSTPPHLTHTAPTPSIAPLPPLPISPLRDNSPAPSRRATDKNTVGSRNSQPSCIRSKRSSRVDYASENHSERSSRGDYASEKLEKHRHRHSDKHRDQKYNTGSVDRTHRTTSDSSNERRQRKDSCTNQTSNLKDLKSGENKLQMTISELDHGEGQRSKEGRTREHRRDTTRDRHSRGWDSKEHKNFSSERYRDTSRSESRLSKHQSGKDDRQLQRDEDSNNKHKRDLHSKEKCRSKEHNKKHSKQSERPSKKRNVTEKSTAKENSPNRKLCFMETLNLTLSPIKKPGLVSEGGQEKPSAAANTLDEDSSQLNIEGMFVIAEVGSSEVEVGLVGNVEPFKKVSNVETSDKSKDVHNHQEKEILTEISEKQFEDNSVHSTSANSHNAEQNGNVPKDILGKCVDSPTTKTGQVTAENSCASKDSFLQKKTEAVEHDVSVNVNGTGEVSTEIQCKSLDAQPRGSPLATSTSREEDLCSLEKTSTDVETVSSTISLESLPQEGLSLPEAIYVLTQSNEQYSSIFPEPSSSTSGLGVSKVSSTTQETPVTDMDGNIIETPETSLSPAKCLTPAKSSEKSTKLSGSVPLLYDEDSMMRTLSSLKRIPDAISPLRSPIRITKRNRTHLQGKPGHVKSLQREFSSAPADAISKKVDINKENKHPGSPTKVDSADKVSDVPSDTDLEDGEILSESDDAAAPHPPTKKVNLTCPIRNKASPKCVLKRKSEEKSVPSKETNDTTEAVQSPPNKSRFKTVCPAATKSSFSTIEEVMETFKLVRTEIRKKYMKLHKTFPKKSFYGVMDNFQESFIEFVDDADFGQICSLTGELKAKLKKIIASVFSKVLNNGIVKRIFEQQAVDLKQKLWDFVDVQVEYMFKDVHMTLKSLCKATTVPFEHGNPRENEKQSKHSLVKQKELHPPSLKQVKRCAVVPYKTGLGSRGKGIRISHDKTLVPSLATGPFPSTVVPSTPDKGFLLAHNGALLDKTDFELLTEQQASSLTFNLVRDSQMGEIFKCLLQGSDLLDSSTAAGDQSTWTLSTPRKDAERLISITTPNKFHSPSKLLSPTKFESPSRLLTTWSSISPHKISSPMSKVLLNPAFFDESCLLEVPSESKSTPRPYSILAEDLAVSLTIPSPLKSDSHLSFLQPPPMQILSTPDSVLNAHISEDTLLDEADASEHDIHLTLDTDNSSCGSCASVGSNAGPTTFLFKADFPMQALVMEKSNDHFIVKIRQAASANSTRTANESLSQTGDIDGLESQAAGCLSNQLQKKTSPIKATQENDKIAVGVDAVNKLDTALIQTNILACLNNTTKACISEKAQKTNKSPCSRLKTMPHSVPQSFSSVFGQMNKMGTEEAVVPQILPTSHKEEETLQSEKSTETEEIVHCPSDSSEVLLSQTSTSQATDSDETITKSDWSLTISEELHSTPQKPKARTDRDGKRKRNLEKSGAKRPRKEEEDSAEERASSGDKDETLSPNSLSAKNVVRRKGEVVMAWSRDEDRAILIELKTKGASRETFAALSEKLNKPSGQIAHRFYQLMKLFKKQEKMET